MSVIQHTSSFEKQESKSMESHEPDLRESQQTHKPEPKPSPSTSRLVRQPNIQVPEILVTVEPDADMPSVSPPVTASSSKVHNYPLLWAIYSTIFLCILDAVLCTVSYLSQRVCLFLLPPHKSRIHLVSFPVLLTHHLLLSLIYLFYAFFPPELKSLQVSRVINVM